MRVNELEHELGKAIPDNRREASHVDGDGSSRGRPGTDWAPYRASQSSCTAWSMCIAGNTEGPDASGGRWLHTASRKSKMIRAAFACSLSTPDVPSDVRTVPARMS